MKVIGQIRIEPINVVEINGDLYFQCGAKDDDIIHECDILINNHFHPPALKIKALLTILRRIELKIKSKHL